METDGTFVKELAERCAKPQAVVVNGHEYLVLPGATGYSLVGAEPPSQLRLPTIASLQAFSLTALIDYMKSGVDLVPPTEGERAILPPELQYGRGLLIHVVSPTEVRLLSGLAGPYAQRAELMRCTYKAPAQLQLGTFMDVESFVIGLQSRFVDTPERASLLKVVGTLEGEQSLKVQDDGTSQMVTARAGVVTRAEVRAPNPIFLAPFRTFPEVEQPCSLFVLRLAEGPKCSLHLADGGEWELVALKRIKEFFVENLPRVPVIA